LVVCADPNNMPFSNRAQQGFENRIIDLVARDLGRPLRYVWWTQRRGYLRSTLTAAKCDLWPGVATGLDRVASSAPYYRSTYVFVSRSDAAFDHLTLDDPRLKTAVIGVQIIGNDATNTPPAHALAERGVINNVRGYMVYGEHDRPNPGGAIVDAVAKKEIDVAIAWGPLAGYYAHRLRRSLRVEAVPPATDSPLPMTFDVSMGVRRGSGALLDAVTGALAREKPAIDAILRAYHVPLAPPPPVAADRSHAQAPVNIDPR
jgi:mxaJ protein